MSLDHLKDLVVEKIYIDKEKENIVLFTENSKDGYLIHAGQDCCSESWFEHVTLPTRPFKILSGTQINMGEVQATRQDYDEAYSLNFKTDKGDFVIEMRNSSNGYYGGNFDIEDFDFSSTKVKLEELKEDY